VQLLGRQLPVQRGVAEMRQPLELPRGVELALRGRFRLAVTRGLVLRHRPAFVEHLCQREHPRFATTDLTHLGVARGAKTIRLPTPQLVQQVGELAHANSKSGGYDTYRRDQ